MQEIIPLEEQIQCVQREIGLRKKCYPKWAANGQMTKVKADYEISVMTEVLRTLTELKEIQDAFEKPERDLQVN